MTGRLCTTCYIVMTRLPLRPRRIIPGGNEPSRRPVGRSTAAHPSGRCARRCWRCPLMQIRHFCFRLRSTLTLPDGRTGADAVVGARPRGGLSVHAPLQMAAVPDAQFREPLVEACQKHAPQGWNGGDPGRLGLGWDTASAGVPDESPRERGDCPLRQRMVINRTRRAPAERPVLGMTPARVRRDYRRLAAVRGAAGAGPLRPGGRVHP